MILILFIWVYVYLYESSGMECVSSSRFLLRFSISIVLISISVIDSICSFEAQPVLRSTVDASPNTEAFQSWHRTIEKRLLYHSCAYKNVPHVWFVFNSFLFELQVALRSARFPFTLTLHLNFPWQASRTFVRTFVSKQSLSGARSFSPLHTIFSRALRPYVADLT